MEKKIGIIGVGNCGSQVANLAEKKYSDLMDCIYINTSEADLSQVQGEVIFKIGKEDDVEGTGKNRSKMKAYLKEEIETILTDETFCDMIAAKKFVFVVVSAAGGTGSGSGPVLLDVLRQCFPDVNFILVIVLPNMKSSLLEFGNAEEFMKEVYHKLGPDTTYMVYDNETTSDLSATQSLIAVNEAIVEDIRVVSGIDLYPTPHSQIDEADLEAVITLPGRLLITRIKKGLAEKDLEDTLIDDIIIKSIKKSCHCETDRNRLSRKWAVVTYFTEECYKIYKPAWEKLNDFIGTPIEVHNHNAINDKNESFNFVQFIAGGLSPINDKMTKMKEKMEELKAALASDEKNKYLFEADDVTYDAAEQRKKEARARKANTDVKPKAIFDKFMD